LIAFYIEPDQCKACGACFRQCPAAAIEGGKKRIHVIAQEKCTRCGACLEACPPRFGAVKKLSGAAVPAPLAEESRLIA
jgi:NADH-quinone oxidoreductase subunit F